MRSFVPRPLHLLGLASALAWIAACEGSLPHAPYVAQSTQDLEPAGYPPPPARVEFIPKQPVKATVWIDGEWTWQGRRWRWRMGRWVKPPPGARFAPWAVVRAADGTVYSAPGAWRDAQGHELPEPSALATAKTNLADVVDPEGNLETSGPSLRPETDTQPDAGEPVDAEADAPAPAPAPAATSTPAPDADHGSVDAGPADGGDGKDGA